MDVVDFVDVSYFRYSGVNVASLSAQVFFLQSDDQPNGDPADHSRLTENVARAFCMALCPHLKLLKEDGMAKLGLRVTLDSDQVRNHGNALSAISEPIITRNTQSELVNSANPVQTITL